MRNKSSLAFAREFLKNRKQLGTPFPSSRYLARTVAKQVVGYNIIELGAGLGQVTNAILNENLDIMLTAFEINPGFLEHLAQIKDSRLTIISASAENFADYVQAFDCVVSGLPLTSMPKHIVKRILESSKKSLRYIQYKYFPEKRLLEDYFEHVSGRVVWRNVPPALVYVCSNNGQDNSFLKR